jgi:photosystem II stability/assembly factor-like uncharacterized protein
MQPQAAAAKAQSANETIAVSAEAAAIATDSASVTDGVVVGQEVAPLLKSRKRSLPSKLAAVAMATIGRRMVAMDAAGAVFASDDGGKHWKTVVRQWSGVAVNVRTQTAAASDLEGSTGAKVLDQGRTATGAVAKSLPEMHFELVTDTGAIWTSIDGRQWRAR